MGTFSQVWNRLFGTVEQENELGYFVEPGFVPKYLWMDREQFSSFIIKLTGVCLGTLTLIAGLNAIGVGSLENYVWITRGIFVSYLLFFFLVHKPPRGGFGLPRQGL